MFGMRVRSWALLTTVLGAGFITPAWAGSPYIAVDPNGVDVVSGGFFFSMEEGSAGSGDSFINLERMYATGQGFTDNWSGRFLTLTGSGPSLVAVVNMGPLYDQFTVSGGVFVPKKANGATLTATASGYNYRSADGTIIEFTAPIEDMGGPSNLCNSATTTNCTLLATTISKPDGRSTSLNWGINANCAIPPNPDDPPSCSYSWRLGSVTNNAGFGFTATFVSNSVPPRTNPGPDWYKRSTVTFTGAPAAITYSYPAAGVIQITDAAGRVWKFTGSQLSGIKRPGSASADTTTIAYSGGIVSSVTSNGVTTSYGRTVSGSTSTLTITHPISGQTVVVSDLNVGRPTSITDPLGRVTGQTYDTAGRPLQTTFPEQNKLVLAYDGRGNVLTRTQKAKPSLPATDIVTSASFAASCTNPLTCNKPDTTTDAKGQVTNYTYNASTGLVESIKLPAGVSGVRPETRYSYTPSGVTTLLTGISRCQTSASCSGGVDESKVTIAYNAALMPSSVTQASGTGSVSATTSYTYDAAGNVSTIDGPLSGTADTTKFRYNADRQVVGVAGPDPDGGGSRLLLAQRITYNADGQVTQRELGNVTDQSDPAWAAFSSQQQVVTTFDANARAIKEVTTAGGGTYAVSQTSYDARGRVDCVALRMDPAQWASQSVVCTPQTTGPNGPDRITKNTYDAADQITKVQTAYGTAVQADEITSTFNGNGTTATVKDAEANLTTYEYDGFDRLSKTRYPNLTVGSGSSSTTDYEQYTYDPNSNVTQRRLRDGQVIGLSYDNLNNLTGKDLPGTEPDATYAYDLLGRQYSAVQNGQTVSRTFDALSRVLTETGPLGTNTSAYDAAGRRTSLTYPGTGLVINYDYDVTGQVTAIRENGATSGLGVLASYSYDNLARRTSITRGNGTSTAYSWDAVSRLSSMTQDLAGTGQDLTINGFSYNPASQITALTRSNDAYAWNGHFNMDRAYGTNGLNQITNEGPNAITYTDARGNITGWGSATYSYTSENMMKSGPVGSTTLAYDPVMRLYQTAGGSGTTRFGYDGADMIAEYNSANALQRRFVHGPGGEPLVWYEGSGTSDRRWLYGDERGSVIATADSSGSVLGINAYDEFGIPKSTNIGPFGYTGQAWLPGVGLNYYRARMYNPSLGRFMQTDPIGYGDGMNWYNYVGSDPVNKVDPTGLRACSAEEMSSMGLQPGDIAVCEDRLPGGAGGFDISINFGEIDLVGGGGGSAPSSNVDSPTPQGSGSSLGCKIVKALFSGGKGTLQLGLGGTSALGPGAATGGGGLAVDRHGDVGLYVFGGLGGGGGAYVGGGPSAQVSNANGIGNLGGLFSNYSGSAGAGLSGSVDFFAGPSSGGPVAGGGVTLGGGGGVGAFGGSTYTGILQLGNIPSALGC